jgi:hypothetical protein
MKRSAVWILLNRGPRFGRTVLGGTVFLLASAGLAPPAASSSDAFTLAARSDVATVEYYYSEAPVIPPRPVVFHSPSTAQVRVDSLGTSQGLASAPEPGPFTRELPDEMNGVTEGQVQLPPYPFAVNSSYPTDPRQDVEAGPYRLHANSDQQSSYATSRTWLELEGTDEVTRSRADAVVSGQGEEGERIAEAAAWLDAVSFGKTLRILNVESHARLILSADGTQSALTTTNIGAITVNGVSVTLDQDGLSVDGSTAVPVRPETIAEQLRAAGIELRYLPAVEEEGSVHSAAIEMSFERQDPSGAKQQVVLTLGRVSVSGAASAAASLSPLERKPMTVGPAIPTQGAPPAPAVTFDDPFPEATADVDEERLGSSPSVEVASPPAPSASAIQPWRDGGYSSLFLTMGLAGVAALGSTRLLGLLGVRLRLA